MPICRIRRIPGRTESRGTGKVAAKRKGRIREEKEREKKKKSDKIRVNLQSKSKAKQQLGWGGQQEKEETHILHALKVLSAHERRVETRVCTDSIQIC